MLNIDNISDLVFYPAAGTDIQPLLRFSHLTNTILAPTVSGYLTREKQAELFREKCAFLNTALAENILELVDVVDMDKDLADEQRYVTGAADVFSPAEAKEYMEAFGQQVPEQLSATKFVFQRKIGNTVRIINWIHTTTEGLATLWLLYQRTGKVPGIICTIQTGRLEYPNSLLMRMLEKTGCYPKLWVRGYWPHRDWERTPIQPFAPYSEIVQDYGYWNSSLKVTTNRNEDNHIHHYHAYGVSYVRAFSRQPLTPVATPITFTGKLNPERTLTLCFGSIVDNFQGHDSIIVSGHLERSNKFPESANITTWEKLSGQKDKTLPPFTLPQSLKIAEERYHATAAQQMAITPIGFEDEGVYFREFIDSSDKPLKLTLFFHRPFDFCDAEQW